MKAEAIAGKNERRRAFFRPGTIFFRIFAWFCLAMFLVTGVLLVLTVSARSGPVFELWRREGKVGLEFRGGSFFAARSITGRGGERYALVRQTSARTLQTLLNQVSALGLKLVVFFVLGGALCYWLARYLAAPILKLQEAAREVAAGDLRVRVSDAIGNRPYEIAALGKDFDLMAARLEALLQAQQRLLRDISHELRSPLARLNVALEIARRRADAEATGPLDRIEIEANRLNELIGQLLAVERLQAETGAGSRESFEMLDLTRQIEQDANFEAQNKNCSIRLVRAEPVLVRGKRELLRSAVENVVRNALRYTPVGSDVEISLAREERYDAPHAILRVRDRGAGVPEEALADLFKPFFRVEGARERKSGGSGLGLTITERAVQLHGGFVEAFNAVDGGLVVEIGLPAQSRPPPH